MTFRIGQLLEKGKFNWKGLKNILHNHEARLDALEGSDGSESTAGTILYRIKQLETTVGKASGDDASGIAKDVADNKSAIGDAETVGTILYRLAQLESANSTQSETPSEEPSG